MRMNEIKEGVDKYYTEKIREFGPVPHGVDWNGGESQNLRFDQLTKLLTQADPHASLLDYGCGYGALLGYLKDRNSILKYTGYDISMEMIRAAVKSHPASDAVWYVDENDLGRYDYVVASGIFNVKGQTPNSDWMQYVFDTLGHIDKLSVKGFAFNILTDYSDEEKKKDVLFYAKPTEIFDYCKSNFSKSVALLHDYPLYEFTVLVRKNIL